MNRSDRALFDGIARSYARKDSTPAAALVRRAQLEDAFGGIAEPLTLLVEIGCGIGAPATTLAGRYQRYVGLDQSAPMIRAARIFNRDVRNAHFVVGDASRPPLRARADLVLLVGVLHHVERVDEALAAVYALGHRGSMVVAVEPSAANPLIQAARTVRAAVDRSYSREQIFFRRAELVAHFVEAGFSHVEAVHHGYLAKPLGQVVLPGGRALVAVAQALVRTDRLLARRLPGPMRALSWDLIVRARHP